MHSSPICYIVAVIFIAVLVTNSEAKRGCALYGHSCYGGHGKRSDISRVGLSMELPQDYSNTNKEIVNSANNGINQMELNNDNRWKSRQELTYALMNLLRKWIEESKKSAEDIQQLPETDTIFKNTFV